MPEFSSESWNFFKEQLVSVLRFIVYIFELFFDYARTNPMVYAFIFFPLFACAFFLVFDILTGNVPFVGLLRKGDNGGIIKGFQASSIHKGIGGSSNSAKNIKSLAAAKAAADSKVHKNMIQAVSSNSALAGARDSSSLGQKVNTGSKGVSLSFSNSGTVADINKGIYDGIVNTYEYNQAKKQAASKADEEKGKALEKYYAMKDSNALSEQGLSAYARVHNLDIEAD